MPLGIPHSVFLGRIVRPGRDPQWTDLDRGYALAWQANKAATCSCGTRHDEWDPKAGGDRVAYIADSHYCYGHAALELHQENLPKDESGRTAPGWRTYLKPRAQWEREQAAKTKATRND